ncbi:MAG: DUF4255 domain-containing protein [Methanomicrobiales archaeon]|nr:DUF4255 domain-containing protein [Methanomicrobiales archaeon]
MPVVTVIDEVDQSLFHLLDEADWTLPGFQKPLITFESPKDIQENPSEENKLCIYLYKILLDTFLRNNVSSSIYLELYYLIVPYSKKKSDEKLILGTAIQIFANHPVLSESLLFGSLGKTDQAIHLLFHPLTVDELTNIWSTFQTTGYHLSMAYLVRPVPVEIASLS